MSKETDFFKIKEIVERKSKIGLMFHIYLRNRIPNVYEVADIDIKKWVSFKTYYEQSFQWKSEHKINWKNYIYVNKPTNFYCIHFQCGITLEYDSEDGID